jgi:hypothetical protein
MNFKIHLINNQFTKIATIFGITAIVFSSIAMTNFGQQEPITVRAQSNTLPCAPSLSCFLDDEQYTFTPATSTTIYKTQNVALNIAPGKYTDAPQSGNKFVCRIQLRYESDISGTNPVGGFAASVNKLSGGTNPVKVSQNNNSTLDTYQTDYDNTSGGCTVNLAANQQNIPKWTYTVALAEVNANSNLVIGNVFQNKPSYFLLYGAIGQVVIS